MSSELIDNIDPDDVSKGQLIEWYNAEKARREKLEEQVDELSERVDAIDKNNVSNSVMNQLIAAMVNDRSVVDFTADPVENRDVLLDLSMRLESVETANKELTSKVNDVYDGSADGPAQAWKEIVDAANRLRKDPEHKLPNGRVRLHKEHIAQATGKSKKMAQNYIEQFGSEKEGADWVPYKRASTANNGQPRKKSLILEMDVWGRDNE